MWSGIFAFVAGIVIWNGFLDFRRPEWKDSQTTWRTKRLKALNKVRNDKPFIVMFGSSRSEMGFSPLAASSSRGAPDTAIFNMSQAGSGLYHHLLQLNRILSAGIRPTAICVEILPVHLAKNRQTNANAVFSAVPVAMTRTDISALSPYLRDPSTQYREWLEIRANIWSYSRLPVTYRFVPSFLSEKQQKTMTWDEYDGTGWRPYDKPNMPAAERSGRKAVAEREYRTQLETFEFDPEVLKLYRDIIERCAKQNIPVAFYLMPESPWFRSMAPAATTSSIRRELEIFTHEHHVPLFDMTNWVDEELDFADGHHLLKHGSVPVSERFGRECLMPWLKTLPSVVP